jgi:hypothetical protein
VLADHLEFDPGFIRRTVAATAVAGFLGSLIALVYASPAAGGGVAAGAALGAANFWLLWRLIRLVLGPERGSPRAIAVAFLLKVGLVYGVGAALLIWGRVPAVWLLAGFSLVLLIVALKVAGRVLTAGGSGAGSSGRRMG